MGIGSRGKGRNKEGIRKRMKGERKWEVDWKK
jgi:hypothetical protein